MRYPFRCTVCGLEFEVSHRLYSGAELSGLLREAGFEVLQGEERLDLAYLEDRDAHVDANVVMLDPARFVEVQGTGEHDSFTRAQLDILLDLAESGIAQLFAAQRQVLGW